MQQLGEPDADSPSNVFPIKSGLPNSCGLGDSEPFAFSKISLIAVILPTAVVRIERNLASGQ
jgi:hypothetical protein